jgi:hypothetical protein
MFNGSQIKAWKPIIPFGHRVEVEYPPRAVSVIQ